MRSPLADHEPKRGKRNLRSRHAGGSLAFNASHQRKQGTTPTSLGYVTLQLVAKHPGTHLRIQLTGRPVDAGEADDLVELNGHVDQAESTGKVELPVLSLVEAEIYRPVLSH